jgi:nickel-dependent lactate racemase
MDLPLGDGHIPVTLPSCDCTVAEPPGGEPVDVDAAAQTTMNDPYGPSLAERAADAETVAIVVTDITRATPDDVLLDHLFNTLADAGIERETVTIVVGLGLHRPMSDAELRHAFGRHADLAVNHDPETVVEVGAVDGVPVAVHEAVADADLVCATGMVEPHQYAGFSGGAKTVAIGAGGEDFIRYTHGPELLGRDGVRLGRVADNPFRETVDRAGDAIGLDFCLNVTASPAGVLAVSAGDPRAVVRDLAATARDAMAVAVPGRYDVAICGVGAPKDATLYQASRAATYLALGDHNPLRDGGRIVVPATLSEGAGAGTGERRFYRWLSESESPAACYRAMQDGYEPGAQRAFVLARVLRNHDLYLTNTTHPDVVEACHCHAVPRVEDAVPDGSDVLVVPDALHTLVTAP